MNESRYFDFNEQYDCWYYKKMAVKFPLYIPILQVIKNILDQMYDQQPLLDETKVGIKDMLRKRSNAPGAEQVKSQP